MYYTCIDAIFDKLFLTSDDTHLTGCYFNDNAIENTLSTTHQKQNNLPIFLNTQKQLDEYLEGTRKNFDLPIKFIKGTPFQKKVWQALTDLPYGNTVSYQALADKIHAPTSARPVGGAVGKNPIAIIVPCHRVIGSNGTLTGFAGGLGKKELLLKIEKNPSL
jgi:methylated-DNA-[protein]-cysteine S-methyltransferase